MPDTPIQAVLHALDALDLEGAVELFAPDGRLTTVFGNTAAGTDQVRTVLGAFLQGLRSAHHTVVAEWNPEDGIWVAKVSGTYELADYSRHGPYERAFILRAREAGIEELRIYGQHELPLSETGRGYTEVRDARHGWLPTL